MQNKNNEPQTPCSSYDLNCNVLKKFITIKGTVIVAGIFIICRPLPFTDTYDECNLQLIIAPTNWIALQIQVHNVNKCMNTEVLRSLISSTKDE